MSFKEEGYFNERPNGLSGNPVKTIKSILEEFYTNASNEENDRWDIQHSVDQTLSEIEELINVAKPNHMSPTEKGLYVSDIDWRNGRCSGINEYQDNIRKVIK